MGWKFAATTDGGGSWSVWDAETDLPKWRCCNYKLIQDVHLEVTGKGTMTLKAIPDRSGEAPELHNQRLWPSLESVTRRRINSGMPTIGSTLRTRFARAREPRRWVGVIKWDLHWCCHLVALDLSTTTGRRPPSGGPCL